MKIVLDIAIAIFAALSGLCFLAARPTPGGVDANVILGIPGVFFAMLFAIAVLWRLFI